MFRVKGDQMATNREVRARPLSPHLGIWRWSSTMATSIFHRATGVASAFGLLLVTWFVVAVAMGPEAYGTFSAFVSHPVGQLVLFGFTLSISFHLLNGIRHLFWDGGRGFALPVAAFWSWFNILLSAVLAAGIWYLAPGTMGF